MAIIDEHAALFLSEFISHILFSKEYLKTVTGWASFADAEDHTAAQDEEKVDITEESDLLRMLERNPLLEVDVLGQRLRYKANITYTDKAHCCGSTAT